MPKITIGQCVLGAVPRTAAIIEKPLDFAAIGRLKKLGADMLEIRVDCFPGDLGGICEYIAEVKKRFGIPLIGTIRENNATKRRRLAYFERVIPLVDAVDIEIDAPIAPEVVTMAKGKTIIVSEHDFSRTPAQRRLEAIVTRAGKLGGHIVKIATMAKRPKDVIRLLQFVYECPMPIVAFSMGELGAVSRVLSMLYGSLYSYGYVTRANAPGQLSIEKLIEELRLYYPSVKKI